MYCPPSAGVWFWLLISTCNVACTVSAPEYPAAKKLKPVIAHPSDEKFVRASVADSLEDFTHNQGVFKNRAVPAGVNFAQDRVAATRIMLTSGSNRIVNIRVHATDTTYYVTYEIERPRIGTADVQFAEPYAVLPADGRRVLFAERGGRRGIRDVPGKPVSAPVGKLRGQVNGE